MLWSLFLNYSSFSCLIFINDCSWHSPLAFINDFSWHSLAFTIVLQKVIFGDSESYLSAFIGAMRSILGTFCWIFLTLFRLVVGTLSIGFKWLILCLEAFCVLQFMLVCGGDYLSVQEGHWQFMLVCGGDYLSVQRGHWHSRLTPLSKHNQLTCMVVGTLYLVQKGLPTQQIMQIIYLNGGGVPCSRFTPCSKHS